ncbi:MAG: alpha/beta hydrolase [Flavobacteriales bacterium]|jgi:fermentation-respiration switch protein FrsA (DUF1100 family)|nr:alpha/beta hydrolase [Flavobacteriales bacterium]
MKKLIYIPLILLSCSCLRLDSFLFNADPSIESYGLDDYEGTVEIEVGPEYDIADSLIHLISMQSDPSGDNKKIHAVYLGNVANIATDTVILYCHGNRDHLDFYWPRVKLLANVGAKNRYGVLAMDYRGFGLSEGPSTEEGMYADVDACMRWLKLMGLTDERLIIYGFSVGSAPATKLTAEPRTMQPAMLMLEAPFASEEVFVEDASGLSLPGSYFTSLEINNGDLIRKVEEPFFWIHGVDDDYIQIKTHGETVFGNYEGTYSEAHRIEGGNHGDTPYIMGYPEYLTALAKFIERP